MDPITPYTNGVHDGHPDFDVGVPHPEQKPLDITLKAISRPVAPADALAIPTPASTADSDRLSFSPSEQPPPAGIEDRATLEPLSDPSRELEEEVADSLHAGGEQAATAAGDVRLDDPIAPAAGQGAPVLNADLEMAEDESPAPAEPAFGPAIEAGTLPQQNGDSVPAHSGEGPLPSAPPTFPGLDDGDEADEPMTLSTTAPSQPIPLSASASPTMTLKRRPSPTPLEDEVSESAKRQKLTPSPIPAASRSPQLPESADLALETETMEMILDEPEDEPASLLPPAAAPSGAVASAPAPPALTDIDLAGPVTAPSAVAPSVDSVTSQPGPSTAPAAEEPPRTRVMPGTPGKTRISKDQHRFLRNVLVQMKKHRCQGPFAVPVDPVALGIPHYPNYVKTPMDLRTAEDKLGKVDKISGGSLYRSADEFIADIRLIWNNCYAFNGTDAQISKMAQELSGVFENYLKKLPPDEPPYVEPAPPPPPPPPPAPKKKSASPVVHRPPAVQADAPRKKGERRPSVSGAPVIRRNSSDGTHRPKREIKAPEKDLPYFAEQAEKEAARPKARRHSTLPNMIPNTVQELKFCREVIKELNSKKHQAYAWPFYDPVDPVAMNLPDYNRIIKKPMDLATIKGKLDRSEYKNGAAFAADVRLMFNNCFTYNPQGQDVYNMGKQLEKVFETKWLDRPPEKVVAPPPDAEDEEPPVSSEQQALRDQIAKLQAQLQETEKAAKKPKKVKPPKPAPVTTKPKIPKPSNGAPRPPKPKHQPSTSSVSGHRPRKSISYRDDDYDYEGSDDFVGEDDYDVISYEQKKDLATKIQDAQEPLQSNAINLIRENRPDLVSADGEEIELDIDALDDRTLYKLFKLVCAPGKRKPKKPRTSDSRLTASGSIAKKSGRAGTGGPKRQGLDENREAAKIAELQSQLQAYEHGGTAANKPPPAPEYASSSSDSESDSDSDEE